MKNPMTILKKRELLKHQKSSGGFLPLLSLVLLVCSLAFLPSYSKASDTETSPQLLNNKGFEANTNSTSPSNWTKNGDAYVCNTCGPYGGNALKTGNESSDPQGGIVSQTVDLFNEMNQEQINHGFDLNYSSQVYSHSSNATVPACNATEGDCRDTFEINLTVTDSSGTILNTFSHRYEEITWTGWDTSTFSFTSTVPENEYTSAFATLSLFGVDSGVATNNQYGGPRFDNIQFTVTYATEAALEAIAAAELAAEQALNAANVVSEAVVNVSTPAQAEIVVTDVGGKEVATVEVNLAPIETAVAPPAPPAAPTPPTVATPATSQETQEVVAEVEAEVEAEVAEATSEPETKSETQEGAESNNQESKNDRDGGSKSDGDKKSNKSSKKTKSKGKTTKSKEEIKKEIATKIVKRMIQNLGNDSQAQATQLALMNIIGANITAQAPKLQDASQWYIPKTIYTTQLIDPAASIFTRTQGALHNQLVDSQYK